MVDEAADAETHDVVISKEDVDGNEIAGADLKITDEDGTEVATWTSEAGKTHTVQVEAGTYTLTETTAPSGYEKAESITFVVGEDGKVTVGDDEKTVVTMVDDYSDQTVEISKTDVAGEEIYGASLTVTNSKNETVTSWTSGEDGKTADGKVKTHSVTLKPGTYTLTETTAPSGYEKAEAITFTVDKDGKVTVNGTEVNKVTMTDEYSDQTVEISKTDVAGEEISGAELTVTNSRNETVASWTSGQDGKTEDGKVKTHSVTLKPGTYTLTETTAPQGYEKAESITFTVDKDGKVTVGGEDVSKVTMEDKYSNQTVEISKTDIGGNELAGAKLQITKQGETNVIEEWTSTTETHKVTLQPGNYTLTEDTAPAGYLTATAITFTVKTNGKVQVGDNELDKVTMVDQDDNGEKKVVVSKQDIAGEEIAGATLQVEDEKGNIVVKPFETTGNKETKNTFNVKPGTYVLVEKTAPNGYEKAESIKFTVDKFGKVTVDSKEVAELKMTDKWSGAEVVIKKADVAGDEVVGATLKVEGTDQNGDKFTESWTTEAGKTHTIKVNPGTYTLTETLVPNGYEQAESITFSVTADGKVTIGDNEKAEDKAEVVMTDKWSDETVEISKADIAGKEIDGATLTVTGKTKDGKEIEPIEFTTNGTDTHKFNVQPGTYTLTETTTPDGYEHAESIEFVVEIGGKVKVGTNEVTKVVMTDKYAKRDVVISKRDIAGTGEVAGAYLTVTDNDGKVIDKWTSEKDGGHKISYAWDVNGIYTLTEVTAPSGYEQLKTSITFTVALDGTVQIQSNHKIDGKAAATVTDDGVLVINNQAVKDSGDDGDDSSDSSSKKSSSKKPTGTTPKTVVPNETTPVEETPVDPSNGDSGRGGENVVVLVLTDEETGEPLPSGVFDLYDSDKNVIGRYVTNEAGVLRVYGLQPGEYYFVQITAPDGYEIANWDKVFRLTVSDTGEAPMIVAVANRRLNRLPVGDEVGGATGDSSNMVIYGAVAASAAAMLALWFALNRKSIMR